MTRLDDITERWEERPGVLDEVVVRGQEWKRVYPNAAFPENLSLAVAAASDLSAAHHDLAALLEFARTVEETRDHWLLRAKQAQDVADDRHEPLGEQAAARRRAEALRAAAEPITRALNELEES